MTNLSRLIVRMIHLREGESSIVGRFHSFSDKLSAKDSSIILMEAAKFGHEHLASACVSAGADLDYSDVRGMTALMHAAVFPYPDIMSQLISGGANARLMSNSGACVLSIYLRAVSGFRMFGYSPGVDKIAGVLGEILRSGASTNISVDGVPIEKFLRKNNLEILFPVIERSLIARARPISLANLPPVNSVAL